MADVPQASQPDPRRIPPAADWYAELERLVRRHELGELSDEAFAREKRCILRAARRQRSPAAKLDVVVATYEDESSARSAYDNLMQLLDEGSTPVIDAAVLLNEPSGTIRIAEPSGSAIGGSTPHGALTDALVGRLVDRQGDERELGILRDTILSGPSAILAVVQAHRAGELEQPLRDCASFTTHTLRGEVARILLAVQGKGGRQPPAGS
jgi:hypothetical protein